MELINVKKENNYLIGKVTSLPWIFLLFWSNGRRSVEADDTLDWFKTCPNNNYNRGIEQHSEKDDKYCGLFHKIIRRGQNHKLKLEFAQSLVNIFYAQLKA